MPFFDFRCNQCKNEFEVFTSYAKKEEAACPRCGSRDKQQIFKAGAVKGPVGGSSGSSGGSCGSSGFT